MLNHTFTWNGHSSDEFGIKIERFRALNRSARKYDAASVQGRNGNIYSLQKAWEENLVSYQIFAKGSPINILDMTQSSSPITGTDQGYIINGTASGTMQMSLYDEVETKGLGCYQIHGIGTISGVSMKYIILTDQGASYANGTVPADGLAVDVPHGYELIVNLQVSAGTYNNVLVPCFMSNRYEMDLDARWTDIMGWLNSADGYAELSDTYDTKHYREAVFVEATDIDNSWNKIGRAVVSFRCRPERFLSAYKRIVLDLTDTQPITGYATAQINMYQQPSTSNPVMYQLLADTSFFVEYTGTGGTLPEGTSKIIREEPDAASENIGSIGDGEKGFLILGQEANNWYHVYYADMYQGKQRGYIIGYINPSNVTNDGVTWYKVKIEGYPDGFIRSTNTVIDNTIIFNNPTEHTARPKITLVASNTTGSIKVNGIKLSSSRAFDELYIDCDNENVTGFNDSDYGIIKPYNANLSLVNNIGKPSAEFISLRPGDNYIVVPSSVGWVELDTRFWEI